MRPRRGACALVAVAAAVLLASISADADPGPPATPAGTLNKGQALSVRPVLRRGPGVTHTIGTASFHILLPRGARQGAGRWYLMRLKAMFFVRRTGALSEVSVSVNGYTALQLIVSLRRMHDGAPAVPVIEELDLLGGATVFLVRDRMASVDESNYAQLRGLRGGENTITVQELGLGATPLVSSVVVLPGSGLYATSFGPSALSIHVPRTVHIRQGEATRLPVTLIDTGDDARHTHVSISSGSPLVEIDGRSGAEVGTVPAHRPAGIDFTMRGVRAGTARVTVSASSAASQSEASTEVTVYRNGRSTAAVLIASVLLFFPSAALLVLALRKV